MFDLNFLIVDRVDGADADWPQEVYRRLGFDEVGIESRFLRLVQA